MDCVTDCVATVDMECVCGDMEEVEVVEEEDEEEEGGWTVELRST